MDDILYQVKNILTLVIEQHLYGLVDQWIVHESAIDCSKVVLERSSDGDTDVDNSISAKRKHIMFKVLIEELLGLIHDFLAHDYKELTSLVASLFAISKVILDDLNDSFLLISIL